MLQAQVKEKEAQLKEEISKLDGMIVQNPERMKADMDKMTKEIEQLQVTSPTLTLPYRIYFGLVMIMSLGNTIFIVLLTAAEVLCD